MKLKLDLLLKDLSYRFNVSLPTVSRVFTPWMVALVVRLAPLIKWPERKGLWRTMPQCFQFAFGKKTTVTIDCFKILFAGHPIFWPGGDILFLQASQYSQSVNRITPQGTISFVSKARGGRISDKFLTENCGLLKKLLRRNLILADRGFTIQESVMLQQAQLAIPAFTKGRGIANVRIHVERVIGLLRRKFTILSGILPIDFLTCKPGRPENESVPMIDKIITVCAALIHSCPGIVLLD